MKEQKYCNQKIDIPTEDGYETAILVCRELNKHQGPHRTRIEKGEYIYWSIGSNQSPN